jgi:hypothetical protein
VDLNFSRKAFADIGKWGEPVQKNQWRQQATKMKIEKKAVYNEHRSM